MPYPAWLMLILMVAIVDELKKQLELGPIMYSRD
jgi:hypothetical protein